MPRFNSNFQQIFLARRRVLTGIPGLICHLDATNPASYPGSGIDWYDISGNNNHFYWISGSNRFSTIWKNFNYGNDVYGMTNQRATCPTIGYRYNWGTAVTVLFWYRYPGDVSGTNRLPKYVPIINYGYQVRGGFTIEANAYHIKAGVSTKATSSSAVTYTANSSTPTSVDQWAHYGMVYNGTSVSTYKNGILQGQTAKTGRIQQVNERLWIGQQNLTGGNYAYAWGRINLFRVYNTALSQPQINLIYSSELSKYTNSGLSEPIVTNNLVFHTVGNMGTDLVSGATGESTGSPVVSTDFGGYTAFNGSNRYLYNTAGVSDYLSGMTISAFIRFYNTDRGIIFDKIFPGNGFWGRAGRGWIFMLESQRLKFQYGSNTSTDIQVMTKTTLQINKWYHVAATFTNGLGGNTSKVKLYINGDIDPTYYFLNNIIGVDDLYSTTKPAYVGNSGNWFSYNSRAIDLGRVTIYNRPLSLEEIYQNFRADSARFDVY